MGAGACYWLILGLPDVARVRFALWLLAGLAVYLAYGLRRSRLKNGPAHFSGP